MFSIEIHKDTWNDVEPKGTMIRKKNNCLRKRRRSDCLWQSSDSERWSFFLWFFFFKKGSLYCRKEVALSCFLEAVALWCHVLHGTWKERDAVTWRFKPWMSLRRKRRQTGQHGGVDGLVIIFFIVFHFFFFFCSVSARSPSSLSLHAISFIFSSLSSCSCHPSWQVCRLLAWSGRENRTAPPRSPGGRNNKGRLKQGWHPSCKMTSLMKLVRWYWQWCISLLQTVFMASLDDRGWEIWSGMVRLGWMGND